MWLKPALDLLIQRLAVSQDPRWVTAGLDLMERALPQSPEGFALTMEYTRAPEPFARYFAARQLGRFAQNGLRDEAWRALQNAAIDSERLVREGAAWGMATMLAEDAASVPLLRAALTNEHAPHLLRRAILSSTLPIIRNARAERLDDALGLIDTAVTHGAPQGVAMVIVERELATRDPAHAKELLARWEKSESPTPRRLAARILARNPMLKNISTTKIPDHLNGLEQTHIETTADVIVPTRLIDQIIGQDRAVEIVRLAAQQRRFVLLVGEPGTGKSLLAAAMAEMMPATGLEDVLIQPNPASRISPRVERVAAGQGETILRERRAQQIHAATSFNYLFYLAIAAAIFVSGFFALTRNAPLFALGGAATVIVLLLVRRKFSSSTYAPLPKILINNGARATAPFVDATGFHAGALLGDVRHDPFQSGGFETPPHELVEAGAIHLAHGGVLFIDEASTLGIESQQSLLTVIQEKRFPISGRSFGSSGAMVRTEPAPCDFVLVLAGNHDDVNKMHPALRSRIRGFGYEIFLQPTMPDTRSNREKLTRFVAQEVLKDGRIPHFTMDAVDAVIDEARRRSAQPDHFTTRLRELGGLIRAAGDLAVRAGDAVVRAEHVAAARPNAMTLEEQAERSLE